MKRLVILALVSVTAIASLMAVNALTIGSGVVHANKPDGGGLHNHGNGGNGGGEGAVIRVFNFGYDPNSFDPTGTTVTWKLDEGKHTVTFFDLVNSNVIDSGRLKRGKDFQVDFAGVSPGTYGYFCEIHGAVRMSGEIIVN